MSTDLETTEDLDDQPISLGKRRWEDPELDITPMIDMTFLLLIFFLVTSVPDVQKALSLPPARHGVAIDHRSAVIVTLAEPGQGEVPEIYLGDGRSGPPLTGTTSQQDEALQQAVRQGITEGKTSVLIKAERGVLHRHVAHVSSVASGAGQVRLNIAVMEIE